MSEKHKLVIVERIPIRWGDMDAFSHVNNTVYFRYMEQARIAWLESLRLDAGASGEGPVIINASCTFIKQLVYPGTVEVKMFCGTPGRSSIPSFYELRLDSDDTLYAEGAAKIVWVNYALEKSCPLPAKVRQLIEQH